MAQRGTYYIWSEVLHDTTTHSIDSPPPHHQKKKKKTTHSIAYLSLIISYTNFHESNLSECQISYEMVNTKIKIKWKFWNINGKTKTTLDFKGQNELSLKDMQYVS